MTSMCLHSARTEAVTLEAAILSAFGSRTGDALLYSPLSCLVARIRAGAIEAAEPLSLVEVFEATCFDESAELRWLRDPRAEGAVGSAVVLSEQEVALPAGWNREDPLECQQLPQSHYLVWGTLEPTDDEGWLQAAEARVRPIRIPSHEGLCGGARAGLAFVEYVMEDEWGNTYVGEERRTGFVPLNARGERL